MVRVVLAALTAFLIFWMRPAPADACGVKVSLKAPGVKRVLAARSTSPTPRRTLVRRRPIRVGPVTRGDTGDERRTPVSAGTGNQASAAATSDTSAATSPADTPSTSDSASTPASDDSRVAMTDTKASDATEARTAVETPATPSRGRGAFKDEVFFRSSSAEVDAKFRSKLLSRVRWMQRHKSRSLLIEGHTSTTGVPEANQILSEARARTVKEFFVDHGIDESRIETSAFGMTKPAYRPGTSAKNRRVVVRPLSK